MHRLRKTALLVLLVVLGSIGIGTYSADATLRSSSIKVFIDTDTGVDDATAIAWAIKQHPKNIIGFTTVMGNTTVENATQNLLTLLDTTAISLPVTMGAADPLVYPRTHLGAFSHGPDGFWYAQVAHNLSHIPTDAPAAIAAAARKNKGMTLIALGPLTNVAQAIQRYPNDMKNVKIVALGGTVVPGNRTPVSEFNAFADPQALDITMKSGLSITLVTLDAFDQVKLDSVKFPEHLQKTGTATNKLLAAILTPYFATDTGGTEGDVAIPDVTAVMYAFENDLGTATSSLVQIMVDDTVTRGQTIVGTDSNSKIMMIADDAELSELADQAFSDPNFDINAAMYNILSRQPDNAQVVLEVRGNVMARQLEYDLTRR